MAKHVYLVSAVRTAIGSFGGEFKSLNAHELAVPVMRAAIERSRLPYEGVGKVVFGNTLAPLNPNIARGASVTAGIHPDTPCFTVHCACASSMQAIISGASALLMGEADTALVGGVESMSSAPYVLSTARWGQRLQHAQATDLLWWGMQEDPIMGGMGRAADFLAKTYGISREEQDELAALSHQRALTAAAEGRFDTQIVPVEVIRRSGSTSVLKDESPRADATVEKLAALRPAFSADGTVTAGNASSLNDGAAAVVLATAEACAKYGLSPLAKLGPWSIKAREPRYTGVAPVPAIREAVEGAGLRMDALDLIEVNEAFASYYLATERDLELNREIVNVNGSGISLGHPVGATGCRLVTTLAHEMIRRDVPLGLAGLCAGGGMGYALVLRRDFTL